MGTLTIERLGGMAGFGGANLKSEGRLAIADLGPADRASVDALFENGSQPAAPHTADVFRYRITRQTGSRRQTIEVPQHLVPAALVASMKDSFK